MQRAGKRTFPEMEGSSVLVGDERSDGDGRGERWPPYKCTWHGNALEASIWKLDKSWTEKHQGKDTSAAAMTLCDKTSTRVTRTC